MKLLNMLQNSASIEYGEIYTEALLLLATFFGAMFITLAVIAVVTLVAMWRMFAKAGIPGWFCLIPIYNVYVMYKNFWNVGAFKRLVFWWIVSGILTAVMGIVPMTGEIYNVLDIADSALSLFIIFNFFGLNYHLAKSFDRGFLFAVGLSFLSPFFYWILGLGDCDYVGDVYDYYY